MPDDPVWDCYQDRFGGKDPEYRLLHHVAFALGPDLCLELGTGKGHSAALIGHALQATGGTLVSVDDWRRDGQLNRDTARDTIQEYGVQEHVVLVEDDATTALEHAARRHKGDLGLVYHDAHGGDVEERVRRVQLALVTLHVGGVAIVHDTQQDEGEGERVAAFQETPTRNAVATRHERAGRGFTLIRKQRPLEPEERAHV